MRRSSDGSNPNLVFNTEISKTLLSQIVFLVFFNPYLQKLQILKNIRKLYEILVSAVERFKIFNYNRLGR
jgi:hypothetical protein